MAQITESARDGVPHSFNATDDARDDRGEVEVVAMVAMVPVVVVRDVEMVRVVAVVPVVRVVRVMPANESHTESITAERPQYDRTRKPTKQQDSAEARAETKAHQWWL